eukprot:Rhum_TRINITY_DN14186_c8_g1::Rhum_TRINITY_DN14186_c8_g1_i1::g.72952::m.72952
MQRQHAASLLLAAACVCLTDGRAVLTHASSAAPSSILPKQELPPLVFQVSDPANATDYWLASLPPAALWVSSVEDLPADVRFDAVTGRLYATPSAAHSLSFPPVLLAFPANVTLVLAASGHTGALHTAPADEYTLWEANVLVLPWPAGTAPSIAYPTSASAARGGSGSSSTALVVVACVCGVGIAGIVLWHLKAACDHGATVKGAIPDSDSDSGTDDERHRGLGELLPPKPAARQRAFDGHFALDGQRTALGGTVSTRGGMSTSGDDALEMHLLATDTTPSEATLPTPAPHRSSGAGGFGAACDFDIEQVLLDSEERHRREAPWSAAAPQPPPRADGVADLFDVAAPQQQGECNLEELL